MRDWLDTASVWASLVTAVIAVAGAGLFLYLRASKRWLLRRQSWPVQVVIARAWPERTGRPMLMVQFSVVPRPGTVTEITSPTLKELRGVADNDTQLILWRGEVSVDRPRDYRYGFAEDEFPGALESETVRVEALVSYRQSRDRWCVAETRVVEQG